MKVRVATIGKSISVDIEEEKAVCIFNALALQLLGIAVERENGEHECKGHHEAVEGRCVPSCSSGAGEKPVPEDWKKASEELKYRGFLYIKCPNCGTVKGFCSKDYTESYHCMACGTDTEFTEELKPLYVNCICGKRFKYMTNMDAGMFDINCINCGNPVAVSWNNKKRTYQTIR